MVENNFSTLAVQSFLDLFLGRSAEDIQILLLELDGRSCSGNQWIRNSFVVTSASVYAFEVWSSKSVPMKFGFKSRLWCLISSTEVESKFWHLSFMNSSEQPFLDIQLQYITSMLEDTSLNLALKYTSTLWKRHHGIKGKSLKMSRLWSNIWVELKGLLYQRPHLDVTVISVEECWSWHWHDLQ